MRSREEIEQELKRLLQHRERLRQEPQINAYKLVLLDMRIDAIKWVLNAPE